MMDSSMCLPAIRSEREYTRHGNESDVSGATTDVHYQIAARLGDRQTGANGGHHGLLDEMYFCSPGSVGRVRDSALLHLRDFPRDADDNPWMHQRPALMCLLYKVAEHLLGHFEVSDHTVLQWFDDPDFA